MGWRDGWMEGMCELMDGSIHRWNDGMDGWMNIWRDGRMNGRCGCVNEWM
jgi:hypothetical protein